MIWPLIVFIPVTKRTYVLEGLKLACIMSIQYICGLVSSICVCIFHADMPSRFRFTHKKDRARKKRVARAQKKVCLKQC